MGWADVVGSPRSEGTSDSSAPITTIDPVAETRVEREAKAFAGLAKADLEWRRKRFRQTTPSERLEACLELNELHAELRDGVKGRK